VLQWPCRCDAQHNNALRHGVHIVLIDLSDSDDGGEPVERSKLAGYCQCAGEERSSRTLHHEQVPGHSL
jgi:hypothetical protein